MNNKDLLQKMGDYLDSIDNVEERNEAGFNTADKINWLRIRGDSKAMAKTLKKYLNTQLVSEFGEQAQEAIQQELERAISIDDICEGILSKSLKNHVVCRYLKEQKVIEFRFSYSNEIIQIFRSSPKHVDTIKGVWSRQTQDYALALDLLNKIRSALADWEYFIEGLEEAETELKDLKPQTPFLKKDMSAAEAISYINKRQDGIVVCRMKPENPEVFEFRFSYSPVLNHLFSNKTGQLSGIFEVIPGIWSRETRDLNLVHEALEKIKNIVPDFTIVTEGLREAERKIQKQIEKSQKPIPEVTKQMDLKYSLFPFQNEFVRFLDQTDGNALIGAEMGLGKTLISLAYAVKNKRRVFVVCPKVVRRTWIQEAQKFFPQYFKNAMELTSQSVKQGIDITKCDIASINFSSLEKVLPLLEGTDFDTLIIDESHTIKNPDAKITKLIRRLASHFPHKILLSGTAIKNRKEELFTQIELIRPGLFKHAEHLKMATIGSTWRRMQEFYKTKSKQEVLKDLPEKTTSVIELDVKKCPDIDEGFRLEQISKLKAEVALAKTNATIELIKEVLDSSDSKMLVFSESVEAVKKIHEAFKDISILHHGQISDEKREQAKELFQKEDSGKRIFVSTRQSLAVGATLTQADKVIFNDLPWTPADIRQAEDRTHRIGQIKPVQVFWVKAKNNEWDHHLIGIIERKYEISKRILEGKQVSPDERKFLEESFSISDLIKKIKKAKKTKKKRK